MGALHINDIVPGFAGLTPGDWLFIVANMIIPLGYVFVAIKVLPILPVGPMTFWGARVFFILCALTHIEQTVHTIWDPLETYREAADSWHMLLIHVPQAVAIWVFAIGFFYDLKRLYEERRGSHRSAGAIDG